MSNLDPIAQLRKEFDIKLQTLAHEFTETLQEISVSLTGITKTTAMALQTLQAEIESLRRGDAPVTNVTSPVMDDPDSNVEKY